MIKKIDVIKSNFHQNEINSIGFEFCDENCHLFENYPVNEKIGLDERKEEKSLTE